MYRAKKVCRSGKEKKIKKEKFSEKNIQNFSNNDFNPDNDQIEALQFIENSDITILIGKAGSGKTACACYSAINAYLNNKTRKIIITRPMVGTEDMGFLPNGIEEKYKPWIMPIIQNFSKMYNPQNIQGMLKSESLQMLPLQFTRGITYDDAYVIIDEAQNVTIGQMKMILTRLGENSKLLICGDPTQIDLRKKHESGLKFLVDNKFHEKIKNFSLYELTREHRKQIIVDILKQFEFLQK